MGTQDHGRAWQWIRRHVLALRESWHKTDDCVAPECEERARHFPPSRYCKTHVE